MSPGLALEIIPPVLRIAAASGGADVLHELGRRLRRSGRLTPRQLAWLLATAVPAGDVARLPGNHRGARRRRAVARRGHLAQRAADPHRAMPAGAISARTAG